MKKLIFTLLLAVLAIVTTFGQYTVLDSTLNVDRKLKGAIQIKNDSFNLLKELISEEKANTDTVLYLEATKALYTEIKNAVNIFTLNYLVIDTITVSDSVYTLWVIEFQNINKWIDKVINDPDIEKVTTLSVYKKNIARRNKLLMYNEQISKQK